VGGGWLLLAPLATNWMQVFIQSVTCGLLLMTAIMVDRSIRELALDQARQRWRTVSHRSD
jgi:hypothetical protein